MFSDIPNQAEAYDFGEKLPRWRCFHTDHKVPLSFTTKASLKSHWETQHDWRISYVCQQCGHSLDSAKRIQEHVEQAGGTCSVGFL